MPKIITFITNSFVHRQTPNSRFGHFKGSWEDLCRLVRDHWDNRKPGYRDGVVLVPVPPEGFFSATVPLTVGMNLKATYEPRRAGEEPRLHVGYVPTTTYPDGSIDYEAAKTPAVACDIVLYASTVLAEDGDNQLPAEEGNWEIVSINPRMCQEEEPIRPEALIANHLHESGGTYTGMIDEDFVGALRKSRAYWNKHVDLG